MSQILQTPQAIAAVVAAVTSLVTLFITLLTKNYIEKKLVVFKLNTEHEFEQRKKIKSVLASNKLQLLNACESLNHRLWNFSQPGNFKWLDVQGDFAEPRNYYFQSFIYRILAVYAWMHKIQVELIHLDTTIATKSDLEFIKFLRFYGRIFSDTEFFKGENFDRNNQIDHIFKNNFDELYQYVTEEGKVISFNKYLEKVPSLNKTGLVAFYRLIDGVNSTENRLRWHRLQILKMFNLAFLNSYGYDFQQTPSEKMTQAMNTPMRSKLYHNFVRLLKEHKLESQTEIKKLVKLVS